MALQALLFMELSPKNIQQATLSDPTGRRVEVILPAHEPQAAHTLMIIGERSWAFKGKASKESARAAGLMSFFAVINPITLRWA